MLSNWLLLCICVKRAKICHRISFLRMKKYCKHLQDISEYGKAASYARTVRWISRVNGNSREKEGTDFSDMPGSGRPVVIVNKATVKPADILTRADRIITTAKL